MPRNGRRRMLGKLPEQEQEAREHELRKLLRELRWTWRQSQLKATTPPKKRQSA